MTRVCFHSHGEGGNHACPQYEAQNRANAKVSQCFPERLYSLNQFHLWFAGHPVRLVKLLKDGDKNDGDICPGKGKVPRNPAFFTFSLLFPDSALNRY